MKSLRILTLYLCKHPQVFINVLDPNTSSSGVMVCPKLEELDIEHRDLFHIKDVIGMASVRVSRGARLKSVRIFNQLGHENPEVHVLELRKHVLHVGG